MVNTMLTMHLFLNAVRIIFKYAFSVLIYAFLHRTRFFVGALRAAFFTRGFKLLALNKYFIVVVVVVKCL